MEKIAIIILNYNSSGDCLKCVSFLKRQQAVDIEIVVVDNCSCADDFIALKKLCEAEECTLLVNKENRGYSAGNNIGLRYSIERGYKYALIVNPDMEFPQEDYLVCIIGKMNEDERTVIVCSDIIDSDGIHQNPMKPNGNWFSSWGWIKDVIKRKEKAGDWTLVDNYLDSHYCTKVSGCCFLIRLSFLEVIGFFDEYPFLYCEEAILAEQVQNQCKKMYYFADVQAVHRHIKSTKGNPINRIKQWKRSRIYFYEHYSGYSFFGRIMAISSMQIYVWLFIFCYRLRNR